MDGKHWAKVSKRDITERRSVVDGRYLAKVSERGITERKIAKIENPYHNAHLHINMNSHI